MLTLPVENFDKLVELEKQKLILLGQDPDREGLRDTPKRVVKALLEKLEGYSQDPKDIFTVFDSEGFDELVMLRDIEFYSMCEHHQENFSGKAHVGYISSGKIVGISKLARLVKIFSRRFQNQERITQQISDALETYLKPLGTIVILEGQHDCMKCRGVKESNATMVTSKITGVFREPDNQVRMEAMMLLTKGR